VGGARDGAYGQVRYATTFGSVMAGLGPATQRNAPPLRFHVWLGPRVKPGDDGAEGSGWRMEGSRVGHPADTWSSPAGGRGRRLQAPRKSRGSVADRPRCSCYVHGMPTPHHLKNMGVYANRYRLAEAAAQGLLLSLRCLRCRRSPVVFLASDLVQVLDPNRDCFVPAPFPCSHCGSDRFVEVKLRPQEEAAVGKLMVRRLAGIRKVAVWRNEFLG